MKFESLGLVLIRHSNKQEDGKAVSWQNALTVFNIPAEILNSDNLAAAFSKSFVASFTISFTKDLVRSVNFTSSVILLA